LKCGAAFNYIKEFLADLQAEDDIESEKDCYSKARPERYISQDRKRQFYFRTITTGGDNSNKRCFGT